MLIATEKVFRYEMTGTENVDCLYVEDLSVHEDFELLKRFWDYPKGKNV